MREIWNQGQTKELNKQRGFPVRCFVTVNKLVARVVYVCQCVVVTVSQLTMILRCAADKDVVIHQRCGYQQCAVGAWRQIDCLIALCARASTKNWLVTSVQSGATAVDDAAGNRRYVLGLAWILLVTRTDLFSRKNRCDTVIECN